jgi:hypothetical protein
MGNPISKALQDSLVVCLAVKERGSAAKNLEIDAIMSYSGLESLQGFGLT